MNQLSFLPDIAPTKREPQPLVKCINGRWCWRMIGSDDYRHEPELERVLLAAQRRKAA